MGGSKSKSSSNSTSSTTTSTQNLSLDGVDGVTVAGSESVTVNMTDNGAFGVVNEALAVLEASQAKALTAVAENSSKNLDSINKTMLGSFEKINQSNQTEQQDITSKLSTVAMVGLGVWGFVQWKRAK